MLIISQTEFRPALAANENVDNSKHCDWLVNWSDILVADILVDLNTDSGYGTLFTYYWFHSYPVSVKFGYVMTSHGKNYYPNFTLQQIFTTIENNSTQKNFIEKNSLLGELHHHRFPMLLKNQIPFTSPCERITTTMTTTDVLIFCRFLNHWSR